MRSKNIKANKKLLIPIITATVAIILTVVLLCVFLIPKKESPLKTYTIASPVLTNEESQAIKQYSYDQAKSMRVTLRRNQSKVTKRDLKRNSPTANLSDTFSLGSSSITFSAYPSPTTPVTAETLSISALAEAERLGWDISTPEGIQQAKQKYFEFYKFMLLLSCNLALRDNETRSQEGSLTNNLLKHPAADLQYGIVEGDFNAVEKTITFDSSYNGSHLTGLYLPAGEYVSVTVNGLSDGESIAIISASQAGMGYDTSAWKSSQKVQQALGSEFNANDAFFDAAYKLCKSGKFYETLDDANQSPFISAQVRRQNSRLPMISSQYVIDENGTFTIGSVMGGIITVNLLGAKSEITATFSGAVETPHFILGETTPEYFDKYLRNSAGVVGGIDVENGQLIGLAEYMRDVKTDEIEKLALLWHSFFTVNESFTGGKYDNFNFVRFDTHVPAGAAVHLGNSVSVCPTEWFDSATNYSTLINRGSWGILHEIAHGHPNSHGIVWGMGANQEGEVRNNAITVLSYLAFCDVGTNRDENGNVNAEHGFVAHPYSTLKTTKSISGVTDFQNLGYFDALSSYVNIMHSFGVDKFFELLQTYQVSSYANTDTANKRSDFIYRLAMVYQMDFRPYYNELYFANVTDDMFTSEQLSTISQLPKYYPIANLYAGGIDGVKTGGDFVIEKGKEITFDLNATTLTTASKFEIIKVSNPKSGKLTKTASGVYTYLLNSSSNAKTDSFDFFVKVDERIHKLTVYLRTSDYVYEPKFYLSNKCSATSNVRYVSNIKVVSAPEHVQDGRYVLDGDEQIDKYTWLVDGNPNTIFHSSYTGTVQKLPHEFVLDCGTQNLNFFEIVTRNNVNSYIRQYKLEGSLNDKDYFTLSEGELTYQNLTARIHFAERKVRYLKLTAITSTGNDSTFTVIADFKAGIRSSGMQMYSANANETFYTRKWNFNGDTAYTYNKNSKAVIRFTGSEFSLYANTGEGYGTAKIKIDGKTVGKINLNEDNGRNLVFKQTLKGGKHTVEIITDSNKYFNIAYFSTGYKSNILNAPNVYLERGLIIALCVFIALFILALTFILCLAYKPNFRNKIFSHERDVKIANKKLKNKETKRKKKSQNDYGYVEEVVLPPVTMAEDTVPIERKISEATRKTVAKEHGNTKTKKTKEQKTTKLQNTKNGKSARK